MNSEIDCWKRRQLATRYLGPQGKEALDFIGTIRDRVLDRAQLQPGDFVLDVGSGDGLLAFGALRHIGATGLVIVDDVEQDVLDECAGIALTAGVRDRMRFILNDATNLRDLPDASVDAVVMRSVLLYIDDKTSAATEFRRVLRPGGRLSLFEPISRAGSGSHRFGIDPGPIRDLAERVDQAHSVAQPIETRSMLDFDERDLLSIFDEAGFTYLDEELHIKSRRERKDEFWFDSMLDNTVYPGIPSLRQTVHDVLDVREAHTYLDFYRRAVTTTGVAMRQAFVYLSGNVH